MGSRRQRLISPVVFLLATLCFLAGCISVTIGPEAQRVGPNGIYHPAQWVEEPPVIPSAREQAEKEVGDRLDTAGLRYTGKVVVDKDARMLEPPEVVAAYAGTEYVLAQEPPEVEFAVLPVEPLYLRASPVKSKSDKSNDPSPWANWGQSAYDVRTGKFYSTVGDDGKYDAHLYIIEYDPKTKTVRTLPEVNKVLGRTERMFGEGKIHGWLDWYQSEHLNRPHLWFCTYWVKYTEPDEEDFQNGYDGGHIMSCDPLTGDMVDYGVPVKRSSWPYHRVDTKRGIMYAVGMFGEFLAWDINAQRTLWAGYLPKGMGWWERALMIDEETGMVYTTNRDSETDPEHHFIKYDPAKNRFFQLDCHVPATTGTASRKGGAPGTYSPMRAQTAQRGPDGLFWGVTNGGQLFTFDPMEEEIVDKGPNWVGEQRYTCSMARSPGGRYLYYVPGAHGHGYSDGSPVIQYDTQTGVKKVLAFMFPYYLEKYGYTPGGTFSIKLDDKGERLFILWNGDFVEHGEELKGDTFGRCSLMLIHIPASEREE